MPSSPPTELIEGRNWLGFAGVIAPQFMAISKEQQFAEKLHAYTFPREGAANTRVKDLVDMVLLIRMGTMNKGVLDQAIRATFDLRKTHSIPPAMPEPPGEWKRPFEILMNECHLDLPLEAAAPVVGAYLFES